MGNTLTDIVNTLGYVYHSFRQCDASPTLVVVPLNEKRWKQQEIPLLIVKKVRAIDAAEQPKICIHEVINHSDSDSVEAISGVAAAAAAATQQDSLYPPYPRPARKLGGRFGWFGWKGKRRHQCSTPKGSDSSSLSWSKDSVRENVRSIPSIQFNSIQFNPSIHPSIHPSHPSTDPCSQSKNQFNNQ